MNLLIWSTTQSSWKNGVKLRCNGCFFPQNQIDAFLRQMIQCGFLIYAFNSGNWPREGLPQCFILGVIPTLSRSLNVVIYGSLPTCISHSSVAGTATSVDRDTANRQTQWQTLTQLTSSVRAGIVIWGVKLFSPSICSRSTKPFAQTFLLFHIPMYILDFCFLAYDAWLLQAFWECSRGITWEGMQCMVLIFLFKPNQVAMVSTWTW